MNAKNQTCHIQSRKQIRIGIFRFFAAAVTTAVLLFSTMPLRSEAAGDLDTTFGAGGKVTTDFGNLEFARAVALQSDDKIVTAGYGNLPVSLWLVTTVTAASIQVLTATVNLPLTSSVLLSQL